jgi:hypothetical protein
VARSAEVDRLAWEREATCKYVPTFDWAESDGPPWAPLEGGLAHRRLAFATSGGFYVEGEQPPFDEDPTHTDPSIRVIPWGVRPEGLEISHLFYDRRYVQADLESMVPLGTLNWAVVEGLVGSVSDAFVSFLGYLPHWERIEQELAPAMLEAFRDLGAEAVLLSPG